MISLQLQGTPYERGRQQAQVSDATHAKAIRWIALRRQRAAALLANSATLDYARALQEFARRAAPEAMEELRGIAEAFGVDSFDLFCAWHAAVLGEAAAAREGCTAIAASKPGCTLLAKNRDVAADVIPIQTVVRAASKGPGGAVLGVSSLGSAPCASSGINEAGLALADTQVATRDHGVGLLRYIVMQRLLQQCRNVQEVVEMLRVTRHCGGGTIVMADAQGRLAVAELGHSRIHVEEQCEGALARTNHLIGDDMKAANLEPETSGPGLNSRARLNTVVAALDSSHGALSARSITSLLSSHSGQNSLCRHGGAGESTTVSLALYETEKRSLTITDGTPCASPSLTYRP